MSKIVDINEYVRTSRRDCKYIVMRPSDKSVIEEFSFNQEQTEDNKQKAQLVFYKEVYPHLWTEFIEPAIENAPQEWATGSVLKALQYSRSVEPATHRNHQGYAVVNDRGEKHFVRSRGRGYSCEKVEAKHGDTGECPAFQYNKTIEHKGYNVCPHILAVQLYRYLNE